MSTALTVVTVPVTGMDLTAALDAPDAAGNTIDGAQVANGTVSLRVKNTNGATRDVTIVDPGLTPLGLANPDRTVTVAATTGDVLIPVPQACINPGSGVVDVTYSAVTGVTVKAVRR
jgi:hypothetical protein